MLQYGVLEINVFGLEDDRNLEVSTQLRGLCTGNHQVSQPLTFDLWVLLYYKGVRLIFV